MAEDLRLGGSDEEDEEYVTMTPAEVLQKLEESWLNEKFSPDLLEPKTDLVDCINEQMDEMEGNIKRAKKGDFKIAIHKLELDRIRFVLSGYLRCRLKKLEKFGQHYLSQKESKTPLLTNEEHAFIKQYCDNHTELFHSTILKHLPPHVQSIDFGKCAVAPNLDSYVFLKVNEDVEGVIVEEETIDAGEEIVNLHKGDQHMMRYRPIASLISSGSASLI